MYDCLYCLLNYYNYPKALIAEWVAPLLSIGTVMIKNVHLFYKR